jgi:hypothetical protein
MDTPMPLPVLKGDVQLELSWMAVIEGGSLVVTHRGAFGMVTVQYFRNPIMVSQVKQLDSASQLTGAARSGNWQTTQAGTVWLKRA